MAILFLLIGFLAFVLITVQSHNTRISLLKAILFFSVTVFGITEFLGFFQTLNYKTLVLFWIVLDVFLFGFIIKNKKYKRLKPLVVKLKNTIKQFSKLELFLASFIGFILLVSLIQGIIYPPNNWDALAYHMPRIIHWIHNESLAHFRTPVYPQLNSPPFSEEFILNINLLLDSDYLSNIVSWFYFLASGIVISLIAKQLGLIRKAQLLTAFIMFCLPEAILLASSTHTELVATFFMLTAIYFMIAILHKKENTSFILLGISLGLSVATKTTVYIYLSPFVVVWVGMLVYQKIKQQHKISYTLFVIVPLFFMVINIGHYSRNYQLSGNVFATNPTIHNYYANQEHSLGALFSNVVRNMSLQFGVPKIAPLAEKLTVQFHHLIGEGVNNPKTTSHLYGVDPLATHENNGANFFYMLLMLISVGVFVVFYQKIDIKIRWFTLAIVLSFLLFCFYLKWQPWAKLHIPFFIFYSVVLAYFMMNKVVSKWLFNFLVGGFVCSALLALVFNYSRPIITFLPYTSAIKITDSRYDKYFSRFSNYQNDYEKIVNEISQLKIKNVGLLIGEYELEYPLFINAYRNELKPIHLNAFDLAEKLPVDGEIEVIVSSKNKKIIKYDGETYYNATPNNEGYLFLFLKH